MSWLSVGLAALHPGWARPQAPLPAHELGARTRLVWLGLFAVLPVLALAAVVLFQHRLPVYGSGIVVGVMLLLLLRVSSLVIDLAEQQRARLNLEQLSSQLRYQSLHDPLTGLANRTLVHEHIEHALRQRGRRRAAGVAVLWLDLDGFRAVNQALGHEAGDQLLVEFAHRLRSVAGAGDTVGRLVGTERSDPRVPDLIGIVQHGVVYTGKTKKIAEHGGNDPQDRDVPLVVSGPGISHSVQRNDVETTQIAPTILYLLRLDPQALQAVQAEHTAILPVS